MVDSTGFVTSLVINFAIALVATLLFLHWRPRYPWCYETRRSPQRRLTGVEPPNLPDDTFGWLGKTMRMTDAEVMDTAGLDGLMFIKFFEVCAQLFILATALGIGVLLPVNKTTPDGQVTDGFDQLSMANIPDGSRIFWAHLLVAYVFSLTFYYLAHHVWLDYVNLRHQFMAKWIDVGGNHTVIVHNLPVEIRSDSALLAYFQRVFPGQVRGARMAKDLHMKKSDQNHQETLEENVAERNEVEAALEHDVATWEKTLNDPQVPAEKKVRPQVATKMFCCAKVDAIDHHYAELERLNDLIESKKDEFARVANKADAQVPTLRSGFVTFTNARAAQTAKSFVYDTQPYSFEVKAAPENRDIIWTAMNFSASKRQINTVLAMALTGGLIFFWTFPMGIAQGLANLQSLGDKYGFGSEIALIPSVILGFIQSYLPALMVVIFFIIVPMILLAFSKMQGVEAESWAQVSLLHKYFLFQVINSFFGAIVGSALLNKISELTDVGHIPTLLGQTIPQAANQFTTYIALKAFAGFPLQMAQVGRLVVGGLKKKYLALTPREFEAAEAPPSIEYGVEYCNHLFVFLIAMTYSFISPIIIPFSAIYFALGWCVTKYQVVHVFVQPYESGGLFWPVVYSKMSTAVMIAQLCLVGILGLKQVPAQAVLVIPLPILTLLFDRHIHGAIKAKLSGLPLEQIVELDARKKAERQRKEAAAAEKKGLPAAPSAAVAAPVMAEQGETSGLPAASSSSSGGDAEKALSVGISQSLGAPPLVIHAEPALEGRNNGEQHRLDTYLSKDALALDQTVLTLAGRAAVGFPYAPTDQNRAYVEGELNEYVQPELTPLVPGRIEVNRAADYLTTSPNAGREVRITEREGEAGPGERRMEKVATSATKGEHNV